MLRTAQNAYQTVLHEFSNASTVTSYVVCRYSPVTDTDSADARGRSSANVLFCNLAIVLASLAGDKLLPAATVMN